MDAQLKLIYILQSNIINIVNNTTITREDKLDVQNNIIDIVNNTTITRGEKLDILEEINMEVVKNNNIKLLVELYIQINKLFINRDKKEIINLSIDKLLLSCHFGVNGCDYMGNVCENMITRDVLNPSNYTLIKGNTESQYSECLEKYHQDQLDCHNKCSNFKPYNSPQKEYLKELIEQLRIFSVMKLTYPRVLEIINNLIYFEQETKLINDSEKQQISKLILSIYNMNRVKGDRYNLLVKMDYFNI